MDVAAVRFLTSSTGVAVLEEMSGSEISDAQVLSTLTDLRSRMGRQEAAAVVETVRLRRRAREKFERSNLMLFEREALEQSTAEPVARHRAARFAAAGATLIHDLGCGIGGDAVALSTVAPVVGADLSPVRVMMAEHNVSVYDGVFHGVIADAGDSEWTRTPEAVFSDPARRGSGRRRFDPDSYLPPMTVALETARRAHMGAIKVAPGIDHSWIPDDTEAEFVSLAGEMRECVLWLGAARAPVARRASVLGVGSLEPDGSTTPVGITEPDTVLFEPDPAVIRAGLVQDLARRIGAWMIDADIAYLTLDRMPESRFGRAYQVESWMPFNLKRLRAHLRHLDVGSVTVKKRGSPLEPEELRRRLRLDGSGHRVVFLTRFAGDPIVIIGHEPGVMWPA